MALTIPDSHHDLLTRATVALSTRNPNGSIQTTAVWVYLEDDGVLRMSLATNRQKHPGRACQAMCEARVH